MSTLLKEKIHVKRNSITRMGRNRKNVQSVEKKYDKTKKRTLRLRGYFLYELGKATQETGLRLSFALKGLADKEIGHTP